MPLSGLCCRLERAAASYRIQSTDDAEPLPVAPAGPLIERDSDPLFLAPDNVAMLALLAGDNIQHDLVGNAYGAGHVQRRSDRGKVADGAIDTAAVELDRSDLEDSLA
jgi:hypothetical protein